MAQLILNRYKAIEEAGRGGFGTVIVAWDTRMRRKVAIKQIPLNSDMTKSVDAAGEHWQDNVPGLDEARTAAMVSDANIVTVHDFEIEGNSAYIIMEYIEGLTLTQFLNEYSDVMTLDMLTCIFTGVAHALEVAHSENVLHLDIKPDNVIIDSKGKVKVTDFGLATLADEFGYGTANAGTIGYMPPEQMRRQALDVRTDQWALAALTYEMLCGQNPFDAKDVQASLRKVEDAKLLVPSSCWEDISQDLDDAIFKALSPDMNNRYDSVEDFAKDMAQNLSNPRAGQKQLTALFRNKEEPEEEAGESISKSRILESLTNNIGLTILGRIFSVVSMLPVILVATLNISLLGATNPNIFGIIVIVVLIVVAAAWPPLGLALTSVALAISLITHGNAIVAGALALIAIVWCVYSFFLHVANSNSVSSFVFFGSFGFAQASPFVSGLFCDVQDAIINTAFGFVLCLVLAGLGSHNLVGWELFNNLLYANHTNYGEVQDAVLLLLSKPSTYIWLVAWVVTSAIVSLCGKFDQRSLRVLGVVAGIVIMIAGICVADYFSSGMSSWQPQGWEILPTIAAGALSVLIAIFLPKR